MELPLPLTRRRALAGALLLLALLAVGGRHLTQAGTAQVADEPLEELLAASEAAESTKVLVHVVGAVQLPGLYELSEGSRVADALARAGGATAKADLERVNLASPVADGTQVVVPVRQAPGAPGAASESPSAGGAGPVHLNSATAEELQALPGIGPVTAQKIVDHREKHGAFRSVEELEAVSGIGPKRIDALRDLAVP